MEKQSLKKVKNKKPVKIDYKSPVTLYQFISEGGKINPARITLLTHSEQRALRKAIKKARRLSLLPACARAYDDFGYPNQISASPFEID
ncbi:MAG: 30S ribosomal protein S18 [Bdellovibrionales bacterium]|nr:30S ribosomal protein S18 [Bdellovibrionales bacterium]